MEHAMSNQNQKQEALKIEEQNAWAESFANDPHHKRVNRLGKNRGKTSGAFGKKKSRRP